MAQAGLRAEAMLVDSPQLDARVGEGRRDRMQEQAQLLPEFGLRRWIGMHITRPTLAPAVAKPPQVASAQLTTDTASEASAEPGSHGPSAPAVAFGMRASHGSS